MLKHIKFWLLKPYPFPSTTRNKIMISFAFGLFIFLFLIAFKPFNFDNLKNNILYFAFIYGAITTSVLFVNLVALPMLFKQYFDPNKWTIYKMLLFVFQIIFVISIVNMLFSNDSNVYFKKIDHLFIFFLINTLLVGIFPLLIYVYFTERISNKKRLQIAQNISKIQKSNPKPLQSVKDIVVLKGNNKNELLKITLDKLLFISYEKNYASVFYLYENRTKEVLLRTSLNNIEMQLSNFPSIVRCHKSFIVNTANVEQIKGNARSYQLKIKETDKLIPVSRSFPKELLFTLIK